MTAPDAVLAASLARARSSVVVPTIDFLGHSFVEGQTDKNNRFSTRLARALGAREINRGVTGSSISNHASLGGWSYILQAIGNLGNKATDIVGPPYHLPRRHVVVNFTGVNDLNTRDLRTVAANGDPIKEALKAVIGRCRAGAIREDTDASVSYSGFSSAVQSTPPRGSGTHYRYATVNGSTFTITLPADLPAGCTVGIGLTAEMSSGATVTFTKNGTAAGSVVAQNPSATLGHMPYYHRIAGCQPGQVIVGTVSAITTQILFDYWQVEAGTETGAVSVPTLVLLAKQPRLFGYSAYPSGLVTDASIDNLNLAIQGAVDYFATASVVAVDLSEVNASRAFFSTTDDLHPSPEGHAFLAKKFAREIQGRFPLVPNTYANVTPNVLHTNGQQGVIAPTTRGWYHGNQTLAAGTAYCDRVSVERPLVVAKAAINVITAASVNDSVEIAIYDSTMTTKLYTSGVTAGMLNSTGLKTITGFTNAILLPGNVYYAVLHCPTVGGTGAVVTRCEFTAGGNTVFFGAGAPTVEAGSIAGVASPLPASPGAITGGNSVVVALLEV